MQVISASYLYAPDKHVRGDHRCFFCGIDCDEFLKIHGGCEYHEVVCDYGDVYSSGYPEHVRDKLTDKAWFSAWRKIGLRFGGRHVS